MNKTQGLNYNDRIRREVADLVDSNGILLEEREAYAAALLAALRRGLSRDEAADWVWNEGVYRVECAAE